MGLFSFLNNSKRAGSETASLTPTSDLRAQPYETTARALPPIRGNLPVAGNGPNTISDLKRAARNRAEIQLSANSLGSSRATTSHSNAPFRDGPAPAPMVPRRRSKSVGRPVPTPTAQFAPPTSQRPKSAGRNGLSGLSSRKPFVVPKTKSGPPYLVGVSGPEDDDGELPPVPPIAPRFQTSVPSSPVTSKGPASINGSTMSDSARSAGGKAGHVDILDAQGALRPSDFRSRLRATGAREYGEDVAERNMGVNGVDLNSPAVAAFYALTGGGPLAYKSDGSAVDVHGNKYAADAIPMNLTTKALGKDSDQLSAMANQRLRAPVFPERTTSLQPATKHVENKTSGLYDGPSEDTKALRRLSLQSSAQAASTSHPQSKIRPVSLHPALSSANPIRRPTSSSGLASRSRPRDATSVAHKDVEQQEGKRRRSRSAKSTRTLTVAEPRQLLVDPDSSDDESDCLQRPRSVSCSSEKDSHLFEQGTVDTFDFDVPPAGQLVVPGPRASARPSSSRTDARTRARAQKKPLPLSPGANPLPRSLNAPSHPQNRSTGSSSMRNRSTTLGDISEHVQPPPKLVDHEGHGTRNESVSSWTPSTVASSNTRSRHTADTSLDFGYVLPRTTNHNAQDSHIHLQSDGTMASAKTGSTYSSQRAGRSAQLTKPKFPDDVYMSTTTDGSDADSYVGPQKKRHQDGEHLLFNENGYGNGLPGLFEPTAEDPTTPMWATLYKAHHAPVSAPRTQPPSLKWRYEEDDDYPTVSESNRRPAQPPAAGGVLSSGYDPVEKEKDSRLDAKLAVQLRKEIKRRERMSTSSTFAARKARVEGQRKKVREEYEQGHIADSEG